MSRPGFQKSNKRALGVAGLALILAALVTLALNANTITVGTLLWTDPTVRAAMVEGARAR